MTTGNKILLTAALTWVSVGIVGAAGPTTTTDTSAAPKANRPAVRRTVAAKPVVTEKAPAEYHQLVNSYCVGCHNDRVKNPASDPLNLKTANLDDPGADAALWERVVKKLGVGAMPPQGIRSPGGEKLEAFRSWLITSLDQAEAAHPNPGLYVLHRLNRAEYANAVRDLLGVEVNVENLLPGDGADFGFDNVASALTTSPLLLSRYMTAALSISDMAVGNTDVSPAETEQSLTLGVTQKTHVDGLPLGTRGGMVMHHVFPADGEYELSAQPFRTVLNGYVGIEGHERPLTFIITVDGVQVYSAPVGGPEDAKQLAQGGGGAGTGADGPNLFVNVLDKRLTTRVPIKAGPHDVGFTWIDTPNMEQAAWQPADRDTQEVHMADGLPRLRNFTIKGPFNVTGISDTPSRERIFVCRPTTAAQEPACARRIVSTLARRAFRRPVTAADLQPALTFYKNARSNGGDFDSGIRSAVARILADPQFLFRSESDPASLAPGKAHRVSDIELASRLSFFLWSSIPDDQLLNLAVAGQLHQPAVLEKQVRRMLADPRSDAMVDNFVGQWLQLRNLESHVQPDLLMFPNFDDNIRNAFRTETEMLFGNVLHNDKSVLELMNANYTFLNERLAKHYGISGVYGTRFRKVTLTDPNRFGLLGQGSILALTSIATRTSPTIRGKYIMSVLFDTPPHQPPPNVPPLDKSQTPGKAMTVRQTLEHHRANPFCASCHRNIDPVGFALENYNPVGQWRDHTPDGLAVDSQGVLVDGTKVDSPVALRKALLRDPNIFVDAVTKNMMVYALGRGLQPLDMAVVRDIVMKAAPHNYKFGDIIAGIVETQAFQMRTKPADGGAGERVAQAK